PFARPAGARRGGGVSDELIVTGALCGAGTTREQAPRGPYTPQEIAAEARRSFEAGGRPGALARGPGAGTPPHHPRRGPATAPAATARPWPRSARRRLS